jgi:PXPV repeat (3 copies)
MRNATKLIASCAVLMAAGASFNAYAGGNVSWSVTVGSPVYYEPAPVYVQPAPVYYQPAPVYYQPAPPIPVVQYRPVYVQPAPIVQYRPIFVQPAPVVYPQPYWGPGWRGYRGHGHHNGGGRVVLRVNG